MPPANQRVRGPVAAHPDQAGPRAEGPLDQARKRKLERAETHVSWMRALAVAVTWSMTPWLVAREAIPSTAFLGGMGIVTLYTGATFWIRWRSIGGVRDRAVATATVDAALVLGMIHLTGGWGSPLTPLLYVSMAATAYRFELLPSLAFGGVYGFAYVAVAFAGPQPVGTPVDLVLRAGFLLATGTLASMNSEAYLEAEHERARTERTYEHILQRTPGIVTVVDREGVVRYANRSPRGDDPRELDGTPLAAWMGEEATETVRASLARVFEEGETVEYEAPVPTPDGERAYYRSVATPLRENGEVSRAVVVSVDISRRVQAERELADRARALRESNKALSQYATVTAHDLREPLHDIVRYLQRIDRREDDLAGESREELDFVVDRAHRLDELVRALHSFAQVDDRRFEVQRVDLESAVDGALLRADTPPETDLHVETGRLPTVTADRTALVQVLELLVENACEHAEEDRVRVRIEADETGDGWVVAVEDDGPGIDPRYHARIFEPFERIDDEAPRGRPGMGLATARRVVERLGGSVDVESTPGEGTRFTFTVPRRPVLADRSDQPLADVDEFGD